MKKELTTRLISVVIQPSLFEKLEKKCKKEYKTVSEKIRELIVRDLQEDKGVT